ncbi:MAG: signal peptide peptidase SppA [Desulfovibrio sp.]|nr:signal peptide peptidase SppA [Desulfovibrio sp.]
MADNASQNPGPAPGGATDFALEAAAGRADGGCAACPLARIPASVWKALFRPPFRKRHPVLFWGLCLLGLAAAFAVGRLAALPGPGERLALVSVRGAILDPAPTLAWIRQIEQDERVKGVLLRVDSPGGGAAASQEIYAALERLARKVPMVVSMGATAASGGLMVSMAGARIYANPSTVTGSIGVRMDIPQLQGLMDKVGVGQETLVTAPYKDAASWQHPLTPKDRAYLEHVLMDMHEQFVGIVAKGRHMEREQAAKLADGKIFTGQEAQALGLVDAMGGEDAALGWLAEKTGVPATRPLLRRKEAGRTALLERLVRGAAGALGLAGALDQARELGERGLSPAFLYQF